MFSKTAPSSDPVRGTREKRPLSIVPAGAETEGGRDREDPSAATAEGAAYEKRGRRAAPPLEVPKTGPRIRAG
jgi:hypothetical protein